MLHAGERKRILPHKVVFRSLVIVFHHKAHHGQVRSVDGEAQGVIPHGVEPCRGNKSLCSEKSPNSALSYIWRWSDPVHIGVTAVCTLQISCMLKLERWLRNCLMCQKNNN